MEDQTLLEHSSMYVCDICGFIYIGDDPPPPPSLCLVCKLQRYMILRVKGTA